MSYPKSAAEWWALADANRADLRALVFGYHPRGPNAGPPLPVTAAAAEAACAGVRSEIAAEPGNPLDDFDGAFIARDPETLVKVLNSAWFGLPESVAVRGLPGFHALCDLCSECHLVMPEGWEGEE